MLVPLSRPFFVSAPIMNASLESPIILLFIWVGTHRGNLSCSCLLCSCKHRSLFVYEALLCTFRKCDSTQGLGVQTAKQTDAKKRLVCPWNLWFSIARHVRWLFYTQLGSYWTPVCLQSEFGLFSCCESFLLGYG